MALDPKPHRLPRKFGENLRDPSLEFSQVSVEAQEQVILGDLRLVSLPLQLVAARSCGRATVLEFGPSVCDKNGSTRVARC